MATQRAIARKLGTTQATVSRALRGDPCIPPTTRKRILEAARQMGYRVNPMVTAVMERIRSGRAVKDRGCLAVIVDRASKEQWFPTQSVTAAQIFQGMERMAHQRGYHLEVFYLDAPGMQSLNLDRVLHSRGIYGIILAPPMRKPHTPVKLTWEHYALASVSFEWNFLNIDRASADHRYNVELCFAELQRRGYRRIGLSLPRGAHHPIFCKWLSAYLGCSYFMPKADQIPLFLSNPEIDPVARFRRWIQRWRPDAILSLHGKELGWLHELGLNPPKDIGLVCLNKLSDTPSTGIDENNVLVGEITCDIVVNRMVHNEKGLPSNPRLVLVEGTWKEGTTLPPQKPTAVTLPARSRASHTMRTHAA